MSSERFLDSTPSNEQENNCGGITFEKGSLMVIGILSVCAVLAFSASALIWYKENHNENTTTPVPTTTTSRKPITCGKRVVGFYTGGRTTDISRIQLTTLTHAVFAYIQMDANGALNFESENGKQRFEIMKSKIKGSNETVKLMISIGGPDNSQYFSGVVSAKRTKKKFIDFIISFIEFHEVDGVDIFWKWVSVTDSNAYAQFLDDLRQKLNDKILSITLPPARIEHFEDGYDLEEILSHVDFLNVYSMDYYGPWKNARGTPTGPSAPLYYGIGDRKHFNVNETMNYYLEITREPVKFNIVIPFFVSLWNQVKEALDSRCPVFRDVTLFDNRTEGDAYMSRWSAQREGWKLSPASWDNLTMTSYIWNPINESFLTFETGRSIEAKVDYVKKNNLGGVWLWSVDMDDDTNDVMSSFIASGLCL